MAFPYKNFLVIGAIAGIGRALTARLVESGAKVTAVGRRQNRLDEFVQTVGAANAKSELFDIGELDQIPEFAVRAMKESPDIDSIVLNAGIQNIYDLADAENFDLAAFYQEIKINFSSFISLTYAFLLYLQMNPNPTSFIFTGSNLAIIPAELHDYTGEEAGRTVGMPLDIFIQDQIVIGSIGPAEIFNGIVDNRGIAFENLAKIMRGENRK
ncbi:uncharacterized protein N7483_007614 [Penicillium malachiteum]|uniref:uncharacterized protein n=1 Tax=Penicillium malachiteum TaxID=1324776 RepID=UPI0025495C3B|nr:uncharacterized protein N7483_007614 [Penicillium malachiteum]KAJ5726257.1 hypothetical protein N7483_007614 [Penicillium malachiteum]